MDTIKNTLNLIAAPQLWTEIVRAVLIAEYPSDYHPIDDSVGDGGNDGYLSSEKKMYARHCFVKPAQKTTNAIKRKISDDFAKALKLRDEQGLEIENWTFVCNYDVSNEVFLYLQKLGKDNGVNVNIMTSDNIANLLIAHPEARKRFDILRRIDVVADMDEIKADIKQLITETSTTEKTESENVELEDGEKAVMRAYPENLPTKARKELNADTDYKFAIQFADKEPSEADKTKLSAIIYTSKNPMVKVQALAVLDNWFNPLKDNVDEYISLSGIGLASATQTGQSSAQAEMLTVKLKYTSQKLGLLHLQVVEIDLYTRSGFPPTDISVRERLVSQIQELDSERTKLMHEVLEVAQKAGDALTIGDAHLSVAGAAGALGTLLRRTNNSKDADGQIKLAKLAYDEAQRYYNAAGFQDRRLYAMSNLANMLRDAGEPQTAIVIAEEVIAEAEKQGLTRLKSTAEKIKLHTERNEVPDYVNGETDLK